MSPSAFALTRSRAKRAVVHFTGKSLEIPIHAVNPSQLFRARHTTDLEGSLPRSLFAPHWQKNKHKPQVGGPRPRPPRPMSSVPDVGAGVVLQGTCGWSDESILRSRRFYPSSVRTSEDRLFHYARHFPCVEVDSSTYAIPSPKTCASWASQTPRGFVFHVKAYGPFCSRSCVVGALPRAVRERVLEEGLARDAKATIPLQEASNRPGLGEAASTPSQQRMSATHGVVSSPCPPASRGCGDGGVGGVQPMPRPPHRGEEDGSESLASHGRTAQHVSALRARLCTPGSCLSPTASTGLRVSVPPRLRAL